MLLLKQVRAEATKCIFVSTMHCAVASRRGSIWKKCDRKGRKSETFRVLGYHHRPTDQPMDQPTDHITIPVILTIYRKEDNIILSVHTHLPE